jgi:hypothetical protein
LRAPSSRGSSAVWVPLAQRRVSVVVLARKVAGEAANRPALSIDPLEARFRLRRWRGLGQTAVRHDTLETRPGSQRAVARGRSAIAARQQGALDLHPGWIKDDQLDLSPITKYALDGLTKMTALPWSSAGTPSYDRRHTSYANVANVSGAPCASGCPEPGPGTIRRGSVPRLSPGHGRFHALALAPSSRRLETYGSRSVHDRKPAPVRHRKPPSAPGSRQWVSELRRCGRGAGGAARELGRQCSDRVRPEHRSRHHVRYPAVPRAAWAARRHPGRSL